MAKINFAVIAAIAALMVGSACSQNAHEHGDNAGPTRGPLSAIRGPLSVTKKDQEKEKKLQQQQNEKQQGPSSSQSTWQQPESEPYGTGR